MAVATGLMLGGLLAQGISGAVKAKKQSTAAKKAADAQLKASQESSNYLREGMGQLSGLYAPYLNAGAQMGTLSRMTMPGPGARFAAPTAPNAMPPFAGGGMPPNQAMPRGPMPPQGMPPQGMPPQGMPPPGMGGPPGGGTFAQMGPDPRMMNTWSRGGGR